MGQIIHPVGVVKVFPSAARTATVPSIDFTNDVSMGIALFLDVSAVSGTGATLDLSVQWKDPISGAYFTIGSFAQKTLAGGVTTDDLMIHPALTVVTNRKLSALLPRVWRVNAVIGGTPPISWTFSLAGYYFGS